MQNLEKSFHCLRQILLERNIEVKSKSSVLNESGLYIRKLEQQIQWISYQNFWFKQYIENQNSNESQTNSSQKYKECLIESKSKND